MTESTPAVEFMAARRLLARFMDATPLVRSAEMSARYGAEIFLKLENLTPVRSFKLRGALNFVGRLTSSEREAGFVTASTGNHGMAVSWAAKQFGSSTVVVVPASAPEVKRRQLAMHGADIRDGGPNYTTAVEVAKGVAERESRRLVMDGGDREVMVGAGTVAFEILEAQPDVEVVLVPVGGGNLLAGVALCVKTLSPSTHVVGVASEEAPAVYESRIAGRPIHVVATTFASGLAGDEPFPLVWGVIKELVDDIVLVTETDLRRATARALEDTGFVVEGAGAASLAGLDRYSDRWRGANVAAIVSGGNAQIDELAEAMRVYTST